MFAAADATNHAIPTKGELSRSLTRLAAWGVLTEHDGRFKIADLHLPLIAKAIVFHGGGHVLPLTHDREIARVLRELAMRTCPN